VCAAPVRRSYLFNDLDYGANDDATLKGFAQSLYVHASVVSCDAAQGKRVLDAGAKAVDFVCGMPRATSLDDEALNTALAQVTYKSGGDEHGLLFGVPPDVLPVGATVQLVPSHCGTRCERRTREQVLPRAMPSTLSVLPPKRPCCRRVAKCRSQTRR
jgi:D-serine deaminase-like pyridoxal phosphate-dependent protein